MYSNLTTSLESITVLKGRGTLVVMKRAAETSRPLQYSLYIWTWGWQIERMCTNPRVTLNLLIVCCKVGRYKYVSRDLDLKIERWKQLAVLHCTGSAGGLCSRGNEDALFSSACFERRRAKANHTFTNSHWTRLCADVSDKTDSGGAENADALSSFSRLCGRNSN